MHEWFRLDEDACKTTQAYDTMKKRRATYPGMRDSMTSKTTMNFQRLATAKEHDQRSSLKPDDLLRMSEGKEHVVSLVFSFLSSSCLCRWGVKPSVIKVSTTALHLIRESNALYLR